MSQDNCASVLERAAEELREFNARIVEDRLVIYGSAGRIDFVYTAECTGDGRLLLIAGVPGFFPALPGGDPGRLVLERLLELAGSHYVLVSKADDNLLLAEPTSVEPSVEEVKRFFSLTALIIVWLARQLERAEKGEEPVAFSLEEAARLITGGGSEP